MAVGLRGRIKLRKKEDQLSVSTKQYTLQQDSICIRKLELLFRNQVYRVNLSEIWVRRQLKGHM